MASKKPANKSAHPNESIRFHPYSQNPAPTTTATAPKPIRKPPIKLSDATNIINSYEKQYYLSVNNKKEANVSRRGQNSKSAKLEAKSVVDQKLALLNREAKFLKIFTCSLDNIPLIEARLESNSKKTSQVGEHMFEFVGQLDSAITDGEAVGERKFVVKGRESRITCVFNEIDVKLDKFARNSWLRCVGKFDAKKSIFVCMKVRMASNNQDYKIGSLIEQTTSYIKDNYL